MSWIQNPDGTWTVEVYGPHFVRYTGTFAACRARLTRFYQPECCDDGTREYRALILHEDDGSMPAEPPGPVEELEEVAGEDRRIILDAVRAESSGAN
jgi:hypothetical protein